MASRARVLVVDDDLDLRELVRIDLELAGYEVDLADDGIVAIERLSGHPPDVVVLDVMMPHLDGWQVLAQMRSHDRLCEIPVVMLTVLAGELDRIRGMLSGAVRYVTKPFELPTLLGAIEDALQPGSDQVRAKRRAEITGTLQRLAELEAGRERHGAPVQLSRLEAARRTGRSGPLPPSAAVAALSDRQREVAGLLADGVGVGRIAQQLGTSRANVYATRQRVARLLGVAPGEVAEVARRAGLTARQDG